MLLADQTGNIRTAPDNYDFRAGGDHPLTIQVSCRVYDTFTVGFCVVGDQLMLVVGVAPLVHLDTVDLSGCHRSDG